MIKLFGWLPSQAEEEDWATLAELQERINRDNEDKAFAAWQANNRRDWGYAN